MKITTRLTIDIETGAILDHDWYEYVGPVALAKASDQQKEAATQNQNFTTQLENQFNTEFGNSQDIQNSLNTQLQAITNRGLAGQGFQPGEEAALRSDSTERAAQQQQQTQQAEGQQIAARSDGGALTSGAVAEGDEANATNAAANDANTQRGITEQNAALARSNLSQGLTGLGSLSGQEVSQADSLAGASVNNAANSYNEVTQAYQPSNFWGNLATGLVGGVVNAFAPGVGSILSGGLNNAINGGQQQQPIPNTSGNSGQYNTDEDDDSIIP